MIQAKMLIDPIWARDEGSKKTPDPTILPTTNATRVQMPKGFMLTTRLR
jgi:hypothetical protein